ncbi:predicted protein [Streptomyces filamentosus NRRL 15998]|uniref:Predicted protein n=1 Tax=Streptomyces filamentosus NRRL 15998 TaxID=457431 RepID=D6ACU5_STRFL|nr:predicted protein [Streptomyces filamentosus NRRL 15998]
MRGGRRTDHHGVGRALDLARPGEEVVHRDGRPAGPQGRGGGPLRIRVRQQQGVHGGVTAQHLRMECADPSRSDQSDAHGPQGGFARSSCQAFVLTNDMPWLCPDKRTTLAP